MTLWGGMEFERGGTSPHSTNPLPIGEKMLPFRRCGGGIKKRGGDVPLIKAMLTLAATWIKKRRGGRKKKTKLGCSSVVKEKKWDGSGTPG